MADVGLCQSIELLHLLHGIIVLIRKEVGTTELIKVALRVVGVSVLTLSWNLVAMGV